MIRSCLTAVLLLRAVLLAQPILADDAESADGNFSGSLVFPVDREASRTLSFVEEDIRQGNVSAGLSRLQQLLDQPADTLVLRDGSSISVWEAANRMIGDLSPAHRNVYRDLMRERADQELAKVRVLLDRKGLARLTDQYRQTAAGHEAAVLLATLAFDRGEWEDAARWLEFVSREQPSVRSTPQHISLRQRVAAQITAQHTARQDETSASPAADETSSETVSVWSVDLGVAPTAQKAIAESLGELDAQALTPMMTAQPIVIGRRVAARTLHGLLCVDAFSGETLWEQRFLSHASRLANAPGELNNSNRSGQVSATFLRRLVRDGLQDQLATDGTHVYTVVTTDQSSNDDDDQQTNPSNTLLAVDLVTGRTAWSANNRQVSRKGSTTKRRRKNAGETWFFLGPPLVNRERLLVLAQRGTSVELVALSASAGNVLWTIPLAQAVRGLREDRERRSTACILSRQGSRVLCPTAAGAVVCVDILKQRIVWAHRTSRIDLPETGAEPGDWTKLNVNRLRNEMPIRDVWPAAVTWQLGDRSLWMSPESDRLFAFDQRSGHLLWSRDRGNGLDVIPITNRQLLIVGVSGVTAINPVDGKQQWFAPTGRPFGRGYADADRLVLPVANDRLVRIRLDDGTMTPDGETGRRITIATQPPTGLRSVTLRNLSHDRVVTRDVTLSLSPTTLQRIDPSPAPQPAVPSSSAYLASTVITVLRLRSDSESTLSFLGKLDGRLTFVDSALMMLIESAGLRERAAERIIGSLLGASRSESDNLTMSLESAMQALEPLQPDRLYVSEDGQPWSCRLDRWLVGQQRLATGRTGESNGVPDKVVSKSSRESPWPDATPSVSELESSTSPSYFIRVPLAVAKESPWTDVSVEVDRQGRLVQFHHASHPKPSVVTLPREIGSTRPEVRFLHAWAQSDVLLLRIGAELIAFRRSPTGELPVTAPTFAALWPIDGTTLSMLGPRPPLLSSFSELPTTSIPTWNSAATGFADVFGRDIADVGPVRAGFLCYQQRGHVIALDPQTGRELWRRSRLPIGTRCIGDDRHVVLFHSKSDIVTVLSATDGRQLHQWDWQTTPKTNTATLRPQEPMFVRGATAIYGTQSGDSIVLDAIDMTSGNSLWQRRLAQGAKLFTMGEDRLGIAAAATGNGQCDVTILDWTAGVSAGTYHLVSPAVLHDVYTFADARQAYVILSDQVSHQPLLRVNQIRSGFGRPEVDGWLHAFNLEGTKHLWACRLENLAFPLHQPRHVPLLIANDDIQADEKQARIGRMTCIDKRTGESLVSVRHTMHIYYAIDATLEDGVIDLRMQGRKLRFDFGRRDWAD